ncbi:hypothetical protein M2323_003250 [Rhodoblastus acidophilus]|uniref:hypothetical protein n=1 Tax=Rhodoblastus acidophilus TaxID=1074 RepID=UPI0022258981|nr:hypothetical protein [Rhodoblastus acidophilus]MCW2285353.1 hypothetical protein [Rhodoblastus acidophilus]MCW2334309.1 hypothetical protein [Rhodoblastus acidophilus]
MMVFGDGERKTSPHAEIARIRGMDFSSREADEITCAFILACELAQGLADSGFETMQVPRAFAQLLLDGPEGDAAPALEALETLAASPLPDRITCRRQEGFAFYGLQPARYAQAAQQARGVEAVIGIRSIGVALAALIAAATHAPFVTSVRPEGPPFRRACRFSPDVAARLKATTGVIAVADEGPGLSGSSFLSVVRALADVGVPLSRINLFPSHGHGPGPEADPPMRQIWDTLVRHVAEDDDKPWAQWTDITGPLRAPPRDLTGGAWRRARKGLDQAPSAPMWERRKFLLEGARGTFVLRFAGLGPYGREIFPRAKMLGQSGFSPRPLGFRGGYLIEEWIADAMPLDRAPQPDFPDRLADYLAFRGGLPAGPHGGAALVTLAEMLCRNTKLALGVDLPKRDWAARAKRLEGRVRRVATDNRLHAWEWLNTNGRILKADASDHCADHTLIGGQDLAWDVAGALCEFALDEEALLHRLAQRGCCIDRDLLAFLRPCYLAFRSGLWRMSMDQRAAAALYEGYRAQLAEQLQLNTSAQEPSL